MLEYMYREYNLQNIDHSRYRTLYMPLKEEILRQYPDIEDALYGPGARTRQIAECFREMAQIVSDHHSNYDKNIYEETKEIRERIQNLFASVRWQAFRYDMELFDNIFSQLHFRRVVPETLAETDRILLPGRAMGSGGQGTAAYSGRIDTVARI